MTFLAEALVTHGIALARLTKTMRARLALQEAVEVAQRAGALNQAGIAALTLIEEIEQLPLICCYPLMTKPASG